ncbi:MAG: BamA/TamA family outer membrane protein [Chitinivibrionales bacterium]|nr:BamA/TamA family outer membrane protein [Chitinivibrionales bacterium]
MKKYQARPLGILCLLALLWTSSIAKEQVHAIRLRGNSSFSQTELLSQMQLQEPFLLKKTEFAEYRLRSDIRSLTQFYRNHGFIKPVIESSVSHDTKRKRVTITITITEGGRVTIEKIILPPDSSLPQPGIVHVSLKEGDYLLYSAVATSSQSIQQQLARYGYLEVAVAPSVAIDTTSLTCRVTFAVSPGPLILVDYVRIDVLGPMRPATVARELTFSRSDTLTTDNIRQSQQRLYQTRLFNFVQITPLLPDSGTVPQSGSFAVPVQVTVNTADFFSFEAGVGYGNAEQLSLSSTISYANILYLGHRGTIEGNASTVDQKVGLIYSTPWIGGIRLSLDTRFDYERHDNFIMKIPLGYYGEFYTINASISQLFSQNISYMVGLEWQNIRRISIADTSKASIDLSKKNTQSVSASVLFDRRNDKFNPTRGFSAQASVTLAGIGGAGTNQFVKLMLDTKAYGTYRYVCLIGANITAGWALPYGTSKTIAVQELFYGGGPRSIRGYDYNSLITDPTTGKPRGGTVELIMHCIDFQFPLFWWFNAAVFCDAGYIWQDLKSVDFGDIKSTVGPGLRMNTPLALLRLDTGFRLSNLRNYRISFDIGRPF